MLMIEIKFHSFVQISLHNIIVKYLLTNLRTEANFLFFKYGQHNMITALVNLI